MAALQYVDIPNYSAILFRRTYNDLSLPGALMDRAKQWLNGKQGIRWNEQTHTFTFPSGAKLTFGYLDTETDKYRYQGAEFTFIGFDELTQFTESQYTYLLSRLRRLKDSYVPLRVRCATNPGGVGHEWVKQRFLIEGTANNRVFVPARLDDNPSIDKESYIPNLNQLDPVTRKQLLDGNWDVKDFYMFKREWLIGSKNYPNRHLINLNEVPEGQTVRVWDFAMTAEGSKGDPDYTSGLKATMQNGVMYVSDIKHFRGSPQQIEATVRATAEKDGKTTQIYIEEENGAAGKNLIDQYQRNILLGYVVHGEKPTGEKTVRAMPVSSACEAGNVRLVAASWISSFLDELEGFPEGAHDDMTDTFAYAYNTLCRLTRRVQVHAQIDSGKLYGAKPTPPQR